MYYLNEAIELKNKIKNHSHYQKCLIGSEYSKFLENERKLDSVSSAYSEILEEKKNLIKYKNKLKNKQLEYDRFKEIQSKELENRKRQNQKYLDLKRANYDNCYKSLRNEITIEESREKNELNSIARDISYYENEINQLNSNYQRELQNQKYYEKQIIDSEYNNKINDYENSKKLDKKKYDVENLIMEKQFKADVEVEMNELKNKAELVKKLISMINKYNI
jgi:hypothetical protein